jgi:hypothetical protein
MIDHYIFDEQGNIIPLPTFDRYNNPIQENIIRWAKWYGSTDRQVAEHFFMGEAIRVSTVFLSIASVFKDDRTGLALYETMVFAADNILAKLLELSERDDRSIISTFLGGVDIQRRYATKEEAIQGHQQMCVFIETCVAHGWLPEPEWATDQHEE